MRIPELLAPAGNLEKLETALRYGADAVYCGVERFSLRAHAGNLSLDELQQACQLVKSSGKRLYLTVNAFLRPGEENAFRELLQKLSEHGHDAYIISDPGVLSLLREIDPHREVHLSTQANTTNASAAQFWQSQNVKRLNLARELSLAEIQTLRNGTNAELEMFVHGAMCVAYSGRCLLSAALTRRDANRGECSHPCRWGYVLQEETRPGELLSIEEDQRGTYLFNSRDLCLIDHLPELVKAGLDSFKIEGRMKSLYYVAAVTRVYRAALDMCRDNLEGYQVDPVWRKELETVSHRPYGSGFLFDEGRPFVQNEQSSYHRDCDFVGVVKEQVATGAWLVEGRNRFHVGEELELIGPIMRQSAIRIGSARTVDGQSREIVQPNALVYLELPESCQPGDILRRWRRA